MNYKTKFRGKTVIVHDVSLSKYFTDCYVTEASYVDDQEEFDKPLTRDELDELSLQPDVCDLLDYERQEYLMGESDYTLDE